MRILVTGAAGFIGSHLSERLVQEGHTVIGVDSFTDYYPREIKERHLEELWDDERFTLIEADLVNIDLTTLLKYGSLSPRRAPTARNGRATDGAVDYVFHLAAQPGVRGSWGRNFEVYTRNNILATQLLLEAAREVELKKLVYASSSSVYGDAETFPTPEQVIPRPISPYGVTKLSAEQLCILYWRNYGVPVACTRYFTVYGPRQRPDMAFSKFIHAILQGEEIGIFGDGGQTRDFTFIADAVEGTWRAGFTDVKGEVFNIGGGSRVTVNHVLELLEGILGERARRRYVAPQHGDARNTAADIHHAEQLLGYRPQVPLEQGLQKQAQWMQHQLEQVPA